MAPTGPPSVAILVSAEAAAATLKAALSASFHLSLTSNQQDFLNNTAKELTEVSYE